MLRLAMIHPLSSLSAARFVVRGPARETRHSDTVVDSGGVPPDLQPLRDVCTRVWAWGPCDAGRPSFSMTNGSMEWTSGRMRAIPTARGQLRQHPPWPHHSGRL